MRNKLILTTASIFAVAFLVSMVSAYSCSSYDTVIKADFNHDGTVTNSDVLAVKNVFTSNISGCDMSTAICKAADINNNNRVTNSDVLLTKALIGCKTDDDGDGVLNKYDLCQNTPIHTSVDAFGCSTQQFCNQISVVDNFNDCRNGDWNLPGTPGFGGLLYDCTIQLNQTTAKFMCVATPFAG
ncbi:MAG: dockerin type I domain-containing protein [Nanoarchaeota archaeon]|nr:dockerin type I domain-containing protein [Nanoarchaeota archaeon]